MIKNFVINNCLNSISETNKYNQEQLEKIQYGLEGIYVTLSKFIVIITISIILNIFKETLMLLLFFNILRAFAFGLHASKSIYCWVSSSISFLLIPYLSIHFVFPPLFHIIMCGISLILFILYAPADTIKRPLINGKKRKIYKLLSILFAVIYIILIIIIDSTIIKNILTFALVLETILIIPITYKIFGLSYNNYKNYKA